MAVYFIRAGKNGPVKIGSTAGDVGRRLAALQTAHHADLILIRTLPKCGMDQESRLHYLYKSRKIKGEWFRFHWTMLKVSEESLLVEETARQKRHKNLPPMPKGNHRSGVKAAIKVIEKVLPEAYLLAGWDTPDLEESRSQLENALYNALWEAYHAT